MHWSKTRSRARFNLATSGVAPCPLDALPVDRAAFEINGDNSYGYELLQTAIAQHCGVDPACVVEAAGAAMANHLAMASLLEPGDEVLIEKPTYSLIPDTARYLGADIKRFERAEANGWAVDPAQIARVITPRTRLVVMTNLHNPTSVLTPDRVLRQVGELARSVGAAVLVDEVYLDLIYEGTPRTSFHLGEEFVVTSSLTKAYGLSGLRCGWVLARPELAWRMRRLNDLFGATPVHVAELISVVAFKHLPFLRDRARHIVEADRRLLDDFFARESALSVVRTESGTTAFPRLRHGMSEGLVQRLRTEFETSVVPGAFFEMPEHFRIGWGVETAVFAEGLKRIRQALASPSA